MQLATLKLTDADRERLPALMAMAKRDYRDLLACAEYPEEVRLGFAGMKDLSPEKAQAVRRRNREQHFGVPIRAAVETQPDIVPLHHLPGYP